LCAEEDAIPPHPGLGNTPQSLTEAVENYERVLIANEFTKQDGNIARTSESLKVARSTLHDKLKKYGLI
jgi:two-component system C4-dicarboxylate transport response regulator DctD